MKEYFQCILILFPVITSVLLLQAFKVGPLSVSSYMSVVLLIYAIFKKEKVYIDKGFKLYLVFIAVMIFASILNDDFTYFKFWQSLLVYHLPCISFYLFVSIYIDNEIKIKTSLAIIFVLFLVNFVISYMQFQNNALGWAIGQFVNDNLLAHTEEKLSYANEFLGVSVIGGITGFVVTNGYFVATLCPLAMAYSMDKVKIVKIDLGVALISLLAVYMVYIIQQRTAFVLTFMFVAFFLLKKLRWWSLAVICFFAIVVDFDMLLSVIDLGRLGDLDIKQDTSRSLLYDIFVNFINSENWFYGGMNTNNEVYQHNAFMSAWYRHGFMTFLVFSYLYLYLVFTCLKKLVRRENWLLFSLTSACLIYNVYSLFHTSGIQSGGVLFWLPYALMVCSERLAVYKDVSMSKI